jgi:hypothetical protein
MDIATALEAARAPLSLSELKEFCGSMFSDQRLELLLRSGDVKSVPNISDVYWSVPIALRKKTALRRSQPPMKPPERIKCMSDIVALRSKLQTVSQELDCLLMKKDQFPTEEQIKEHMDRLHRYNEQKDIGQGLLGHLAEIKNCKVQKMYEEYGLDEND